MTFEITTTDKPGNFATAKISVVPEELKDLFPKPLRATCTAGEEYAAKSLIVKILNVMKRHLRHELVCLNPGDHYPTQHRWKVIFRN